MLWTPGFRLRSGPYSYYGKDLGCKAPYLFTSVSGKAKWGLKGWFLVLPLSGALELINACGHRCAGVPGVWVSMASRGRRVTRQMSVESSELPKELPAHWGGG